MIKDAAIRARFEFQVLKKDFLVLVGINQPCLGSAHN